MTAPHPATQPRAYEGRRKGSNDEWVLCDPPGDIFNTEYRGLVLQSELEEALRALEIYRDTNHVLRETLTVVQASLAWQPIETAPKDTPILLYAPPEKLSHDPDQQSDIRVSTTRNWCWSTHWMPLPAAQVLSQAPVTDGADPFDVMQTIDPYFSDTFKSGSGA